MRREKLCWGERTRDVARARLGNVLREDRTAVSARDLQLMQLDVLALSDYLEMERDQAHITVSATGGAGRSLLEFHRADSLCPKKAMKEL